MDFRRAVVEVQRAAARAAREVVDDPRVVRQVEEAVVGKLEDALLRNKIISNPAAWGFKVGRHEALRLVRGPDSSRVRDRDPAEHAEQEHASRSLPSQSELRLALAGKQKDLTGKQWEAVQAVLKHGSFSAAAQALGKDKRGVSRLFRRALERIRSLGG